MEELFKNLQKDHNNTLGNIITWMKNSKIVDGKNVTEEHTRQLFSGVKDPNNVEYAKFQEVIGQLEHEHKMSIGDYAKKLIAEGPKFINEIKSFASTAVSTIGNIISQTTSGKSAGASTGAPAATSANTGNNGNSGSSTNASSEDEDDEKKH